MLQTYLNRIHDVAQQRGVRKNYFHWSLGNLIRDYAEDMGLENVRIVVRREARRTDDRRATDTGKTGAPLDGSGAGDLRIEDGKGEPIGYVRTSAPDAVLDGFEEDGRRDDVAAGSFNDKRTAGGGKAGAHGGTSNLLLTNFYGFRLYREGELVEALTIDPPTADADEGAQASDEEEAAFGRLIRAFFRPT